MTAELDASAAKIEALTAELDTENSKTSVAVRVIDISDCEIEDISIALVCTRTKVTTLSAKSLKIGKMKSSRRIGSYLRRVC